MTEAKRTLYDDYEGDAIEIWEAIEELRERLARLEASEK